MNPIDQQYGMSRSLWDDYKATYMPLEQVLSQQFFNPAAARDQVNQSVNDVAEGFSNAAGARTRTLSRLGLSATPEQDAAFQRQQTNAQGLATLTAANSTQRAIANRDRGGVMGLG